MSRLTREPRRARKQTQRAGWAVLALVFGSIVVLVAVLAVVLR